MKFSSCLLLSIGCLSFAVAPAAESELVRSNREGRLVYKASSPEGDTILDFSNCGYGGGGVALPKVAVKLKLKPVPNAVDDTERIQRAIDELSQLPLRADGFRGALLLRKGIYRVQGTLKLTQSGVVLRGEGSGPDGTVLVATGVAKRSLIEVKGAASPKPSGTPLTITDRYVPVGARSFSVTETTGLKVGSAIFVVRHGNAAWIHEIGMDAITPRPTSPSGTRNWEPFDLRFDRVITAIDGNKITIDAPVACAIDQRWGGGEVVACDDSARIEHVGVEHLRADSEFDPKVTKTQPAKDKTQPDETYFADEEHAVRLVLFDNIKNGWGKDLVAVHFFHGVSEIGGGAKWITIQDSASLDPVSVITGSRRYPFSISGQLNLVQRCYSRDGRHAFVFGARVCGPNVFLDCKSERDYATSEPHHRWSCGGLYDNVRAELAFQDRQWMGSGHGWAGANYVAWNTEGSLICQRPPTAQNFAIGHVGKKLPGAFEGRADGYWESTGEHVTPRSLYLAQLRDRLGRSAVRKVE
jgi:hypothetical protein